MISVEQQSDNRLLVGARSGQKITPVWLVIILSFAFVFLAQMGGAPLVIFNLIRRASDLKTVSELNQAELTALALPQTAWEQTLFLVSSFVGIYLLIWLWVRFYERRSFRSLGLAGKGAWWQFGRGFLVGGLMFGAAVGAMAALGYYTVSAGVAVGGGVLGGVLLVLVGWLVQGPAEELLYRGWVLPVVGARRGLWVGVGLSALLFAVTHALNPNIGVVAFLNLFLFGVFAAFYALAEESLWGVFGIHAVWNWVQGHIFGLEVSGMRMTGGSIWIMDENGPDFITGGRFGPEGGLVVTLILLIGCGILWWLKGGLSRTDNVRAVEHK